MLNCNSCFFAGKKSLNCFFAPNEKFKKIIGSRQKPHCTKKTFCIIYTNWTGKIVAEENRNVLNKNKKESLQKQQIEVPSCRVL